MSASFPETPRIAIIGAGALGCYYGARLVKAGEDVHILARSGRAALTAQGLKVKTPTERITARKVHIYGSSAEIGPCDLVIIATKATANEALRQVLPPLLKPDTVVLTLQNGLGVEEPVAEVAGPDRVIGAICYIGCVRTAPGVVACSFPGLMTIGKFGKPAGERTHAVAALWRRAGVKCTAQDNLELQRWHKLVWNVPFNGLAIVAGVTTDVLLADEGLRLLARRIMEEVVEAAAKFGHEIPRSFVDLQFERTAKMAAYRPSSLIDFEEGRDLEIEEIWGEPVRRAKSVGAAVPRMEMLYWLIKQRIAQRNAQLKAKARKR
ncbi:2-dehydropantoate 2-reductase [Lacunisphaera limnophila]|uniref:2-dehydropantoate 2-reductase n=1 Tax=Lacunisphaera limnophila TaxID=1838286 RepID=A0A1D8ART0_9BACT|nr:2-dehydropantoate 2-reductase [Lacunisphaera limnophila]AOS43605.1 2-dehydropantoate 2-reductase [Lacunisphaera limnophila]